MGAGGGWAIQLSAAALMIHHPHVPAASRGLILTKAVKGCVPRVQILVGILSETHEATNRGDSSPMPTDLEFAADDQVAAGAWRAIRSVGQNSLVHDAVQARALPAPLRAGHESRKQGPYPAPAQEGWHGRVCTSAPQVGLHTQLMSPCLGGELVVTLLEAHQHTCVGTKTPS